MVILWTNLEGEKVEPSPTAQRPAPDGGRSNSSNGGQLSLKRRVQVALKPSLPSLFLPLIKPNNGSQTTTENHSPGPNTDSVSLPSSLDSSPTLPDDDLRLVVIRSGDLSPDSGVLIQFEPTPSPSIPTDPARPTTLPAQRSKPPKTLPIIYGTDRNELKDPLPSTTTKQQKNNPKNNQVPLSGENFPHLSCVNDKKPVSSSLERIGHLLDCFDMNLLVYCLSYYCDSLRGEADHRRNG